MKYAKGIALLLAAALLLPAACASPASEEVTQIQLSDEGIAIEGDAEAVAVGGEIVYYHDGTDASYGEGKAAEAHTAEEAAAHTLVTITKPGTYRLSGALSLGQIAVDLGENAKDDPSAVVTLILDNVDVTCTVAPALIFYNVYECDREWVAYDKGENEDYKATSEVDTADAGANVILAAGSVNTFTGSHVARIYKEGTTKKLHKYDGAFYSKMSMNIDGEGGDDSGVLNIIADNEGLDSELHLTVNGGTINIQSQDDGINTNEDGVSVTTINGGALNITAGLGSEGDGIDSNGYLVLNGGTVWTTANPQSGDGGIDADSPILINGGTVYAFGSRNDAADSASAQPYLELSFASTLPAESQVRVMDENEDLVIGTVLSRPCQSLTLSCPELALDTTYHVYVDGVLQCYSGNSFGMMGRGGMGGGRPEGGQRPPEAADGETPPELPDGETPPEAPDGQQPQSGQAPDFGGRRGQEGREDFDPSQRPDGEEFDPAQRGGKDFDPDDLPEDFDPAQFGGKGDMGGFPGDGAQADGSGSTDFVLTQTVKSFSGVCDSDASGKTRVSFTVEGVQRTGRSATLAAVTAITPSVDLDPALVQITVTDDPSESYAASCTLADGLEAVNALLPTDDGDYLLTVAVVSGNETYTGATQISFNVGALPFTDVSENDEGYEAIRSLYKAGAMQGTGEGRFSPHMTLTRAQAVTVLARLAGAEEAETDAFGDVAADSWYSGYVGWAVEQGIVEGDGQGHFYPELTVTGEQMELMLGRWRADYQAPAAFDGELTRAQLAQMLAAALD